MVPNPAFWRGKRVFVTGHTGFKGSWLTIWLRLLGAEVSGFALEPPTQPSMYELTGAGEGIRSVIGDVRDATAVGQALSAHEPDVVFHLAAQSIVRRSYTDPLDTLSTNILGVANTLEAVRAIRPPSAVVVITSDKCYENREWTWAYREDDELGGHDPYSASKACAEIVARSYRLSYLEHAGVPLATTRAGNVIGGGDWTPDQLIPDIARALLSETLPEIRSPLATRPWQHVLEPLCGYLTLAEYLAAEGGAVAEAWNFGPPDDDAKPVSWIAATMAQLWGANGAWTKQPGDHPHESTYLKLDASKARSRLGWRPRLPVAQSLEWTVEWYRAYRDGADLRALTESQVERYTALRSAEE
jgi:CDP-glucose 4,6-dehydratase